MRSDKIRDIPMNFDSIAATSLDVSYGDSVTSASDPMEIAGTRQSNALPTALGRNLNRAPHFTYNRNGRNADPPWDLRAGKKAGPSVRWDRGWTAPGLGYWGRACEPNSSRASLREQVFGSSRSSREA